MYNYHADTVGTIDILLVVLSFFLAIVIMAYVIARRLCDAVRDGRLVTIKNALYRLELSPDKASEKNCLAIIHGSTIQQFLDIEGNRRKEAVFFNQTDQGLFKKYYLSAGNIRKIELVIKWPRNKWERIEAIIALGYSQKDRCVPLLAKYLSKRDPDVSYFSAIALGNIHSKSSLDALIKAFKSNFYIRRKIATIIETFPADIVIKEANRLLDDKDWSVKYWALKVLSKFKPVSLIDKIEELSEDHSADVRAAACKCLGSINNKRSEECLERLLNDDAWFVRMQAVRAMAKNADTKSIKLIVKMLGDSSLFVLESVKTAIKENAVMALPHLGEVFEKDDDFAKRNFIEAIQSFLIQNPDEALRSKIIEAVRKISPPIAKRIKDRIHNFTGGIA